MASKNGYTLGFLGCGTMGTAVLTSVISSLSDAPSDGKKPTRLIASVSSKSSQQKLQDKFGDQVEVVLDNEQVVTESDIIVIGLKPFLVEKVLGVVSKYTYEKKVFVSLAAGKTITQLSTYLGPGAEIVVRAMTNTPATIGHGMTVVSVPPEADSSCWQIKAVEWIFSNTGRVLFLDEKHQDVATALCGSGPAFAYLMMEALCDGAVRMGLPYQLARECAAQVFSGAGQMVLQSGENPAVLRTSVCTPGGTTIGGLLVLEDKGVRGSIARSVEEATNIATKLANK